MNRRGRKKITNARKASIIIYLRSPEIKPSGTVYYV
jgi:hypothetical protein